MISYKLRRIFRVRRSFDLQRDEGRSTERFGADSQTFRLAEHGAFGVVLATHEHADALLQAGRRLRIENKTM